MRIRRFNVDDLGGDVIHVSGQEADHALRVLRLKLGAEVVLFNGRGEEAAGRIVSIGDGAFDVEISRKGQPADRRKGSLAIAVATPKGQRADWMVEKCAEFGVAALRLLRTDRGAVDPGEGKLSRWRRKAVEAAKQSGSATAMEIVAPRSVEETLGDAGARHILCCEPHRNSATLAQFLTALPRDEGEPRGVLAFVGPEGGFTEREIEAISQAGGQAVRLAGSILRVETAAAAVAAAWAMWNIEG